MAESGLIFGFPTSRKFLAAAVPFGAFLTKSKRRFFEVMGATQCCMDRDKTELQDAPIHPPPQATWAEWALCCANVDEVGSIPRHFIMVTAA
eukprot:s243_g25.t1